jgi:hypothetical protein
MGSNILIPTTQEDTFVSRPVHEANLCYGTEVIKASVDPILWVQVIADIGCDPPAPVAFLAVTQAIQQLTASSSRHLVAKLVALRLCDEPGEDVLKFSCKVLNLAKRIECCVAISSPLSLSVI